MSVYCGYCGKRGHNRLGCPERKREARENPDGFEAHQIKREAETRRRAVANRRCSYCGGSGHNRRGCKVRKFDEKEMLDRAISYRKSLSKVMIEKGVGVGTLVQVPIGNDLNYFMNYIITDINWSPITHRMKGPAEDNLITESTWGGFNYVHEEQSCITARSFSHNLPPHEAEGRSWAKPNHVTMLDPMRFVFDGLHRHSDEKVRYQYEDVALEDWKYKIIGPMSSSAVQRQIDATDLNTPIADPIRASCHLDDGWRRLKFELPDELRSQH